MERWIAKVISLIAVFILPLVGTLLPYKVSGHFTRKGEAGKKALSCLMCFGGGVFFATYLLHMAPESRYILGHALIDPYNIKYPVADLIMGAGFFLVFFMEKAVLKWYKRRHQNKVKRRREQCLQINKVGQKNTENGDHAYVTIGPVDPDGCGECNGGDCEGCAKLPKPKPNGELSNGNSTNNREISNVVNPSQCPLLGTGDCCADPVEVKAQMTAGEADDMIKEEPKTEEDLELAHSHGTRSLVLIVALSLHRIFEGMSLGLQHSAADVWNLFAAVMCHEVVIGFGLGLQFVKNGFSLNRMLLACFLCSAIMPVGVAFGTLLVEVGGSGNGFDLINGILQSVATGTFIYVTFFEILQEEIDPHDTNMSKFFSVFIGFVIMAALCAIPETPTTEADALLNGQHNTTLAYLVSTTTGMPGGL